MQSNYSGFNTLEMAEKAIGSMTASDIIKLKQFARAVLVISPTELNEDELLNESLLRTLEGDRSWNSKLNIVQHLIGVMKSIASDQRRSKSAKVEVFSEDLSDTEHNVCLMDKAVNSATQIIQYEQFLEVLFKTFQGDKHSLLLIEGFIEGYKRNEIMELNKLTENEYGSARKRITRKLIMEDF